MSSNNSSTMSSRPTLSESERSALREKYSASLDYLRQARLRSAGIKKIYFPTQAATLAAMLRDGRAIRWLGNRQEVKARAGDPQKFMLSLTTRRCAGMFVCYWNGVPTVDPGGKPQVVPTKENPIIIYEGGHRSRWLDQIFSNTTEVFDGLDMETLKEIEPEAYEDIRTACIALTVNTHESGTVPIDFIKDEYNAINTTMAPFNTGETVAASTDEIRNELQADLATAIAGRKGGKKARDGDKTELRALVNAALGQIADTKIDSLIGQTEPTEDAILRASENIRSFGSIETHLNAMYPNNPAAKKRMTARKSDFKLDATVMVALGNCVSTQQREETVEAYLSFYRMFFADKDVWTAAVKEVAGGGAGKHNTGNGVFTSRWKKLLSKVRPAAPIAEGEALSSVQA